MTLEKKTDALTLYFPSPTLIRPHLGITSYCAFVVKSAKLRSGSVRSEFRSRSISVLDFSYLESPEFIGVQGLLRVKKKKRALLRIPVMRVLRISNMYPARAPSILPSPVPAHVPAASGRWLSLSALPLGTWGLAHRPGRLARGGSGPWASRQHGCSYSFHAPYYSPYGLDPTLSAMVMVPVFSTMIRGHLYLLMVRFDLRFPASSPAPPPHSPRSEYRSDSLTPSCRSHRVPNGSKFHRSDMSWRAPDRRRRVSRRSIMRYP